MRIETLEFIKSSDLKKERFDFSADKLNILGTPTGFGKSQVAEAIWSILYGRPSDNEQCRIRAGVLTVRVGQRRYVVSRDFADGRSSLRELTGPEVEINPTSAEPAGQLLCGLNLEVFRQVCLMDGTGSNKLFTPAEKLSSLLSLGKDADQGPEQAIVCIEQTLQHYPFRGRQCAIDELIAALERGQIVLRERLQGLEQEKLASSVRLAEVADLEREIADLTRRIKQEEQVQLRLQIDDLASRILRVQELLMHEAELHRHLRELGDLSDFPMDVVGKVEELWQKRQSTIETRQALAGEVLEFEQNAAEINQALEQTPELEECLPEDAQTLYGLARTLESVESELDELRFRRAEELRRVKSTGLDIDRVAVARKAITTMESQDLDEANSLALQMKKSKQELSEASNVYKRFEREITETKAELARAQKSEKRWRSTVAMILLALACLVTSALIAAPSPARGEALTVSISIIVTAVAFSIFIFLLLGRNKSTLSGRLNRLIEDYDTFSQSELGMSSELGEVYRRADELARHYELSSGVELLRQINSYAGKAPSLKDLDLLDQIIISRERQQNRIITELQKLFARAGRDTAVSVTSACRLADDIHSYKELMRESQRIQTILLHKKSELRFLQGEINDIESRLRDAFYRARLRQPEMLADSLHEFLEKAGNHERFELVQAELQERSRLRKAELLEQDLPQLLHDLQTRQQEAIARLQELTTANPFLTETPADDSPGPLEAAELAGQVQVLQFQYNELREEIRAINKNYDEFYPKTQHELETLERDLCRLKHNKQALELAKSLLSNVASRSRSSWSSQLSQNCAFLLEEAGLEFERLEWDNRLGLKLHAAGLDEGLPPEELQKRLSQEMLSQLDWLVQMAIALVVSEKGPVPLILDEPFAQVDDQRFLSSMKLMLKLLPRLQIIVLTCHQLRHQWLMENLKENERLAVQLHGLENLASKSS